MKIKRWVYNKNSFEDFYILYEDENYILVNNINTKLLNDGDALVDFKDLAYWASEVVRLRHEIRGLL